MERGEHLVKLNPCYEYMSDLQIAQGHQPGQIAIMGRTQILLPFDHTLLPFPVVCRVDIIGYLKDMAPEDSKRYLAAIDNAREHSEQARRKRDSNLIIVPGGAMPKGDPPRAS